MAVLNENGNSGNFVRSQALKLCILKNSLFLLPLSFFRLESHAFAVRAGGPALPCTTLFHTDSFHIHPVLSFDFFCLHLPRTGRCVPSLSVAVSGTTFMKVSLCCFLIRQVFQRLIECIPKCVWSCPCLKMLLWCHSYKPPYYRNRDINLTTGALKIKSISV